MAKGYDIDDVPAGGRQNKKRPGDLVEFVKLGEKYTQLRIVGETFLYGGHWVKVKKRDNSMSQFYTPCSAFDPETGKRDSTKDCPWCKHEGDSAKGEALSRFSVDAYTNVVVRKLQKAKPEELDDPTDSESESGFKEKDSPTWTPVQVLRMPNAIIRGIRELKELNVHEVDGDSQAFGMSHPKYGCDVLIKKDVKAASPSQMYSVQKGDHKPLNKEERKYLGYDLSDLQEYPSDDEANDEFKRWAERMLAKKKKSSLDDDDGEDETPKRKKSSAFDEEEEDEKPRKKKPLSLDEEDDDVPPPKKKRRPEPEDEEEEEAPPPRKKKPPVDEDDEEEEEEPAPKKKKPVRKPEPDEEEEDEPKPKKKKPVASDFDDDDL